MDKKYKGIDKFSWNEKILSHLNLRIPKCENEVQAIANQLPDVFNDATKVTKSHSLVINTPTQIIVSEQKPKEIEQPRPHLKRGQPIGSKDVVPQKMMGRN